MPLCPGESSHSFVGHRLQCPHSNFLRHANDINSSAGDCVKDRVQAPIITAIVMYREGPENFGLLSELFRQWLYHFLDL